MHGSIDRKSGYQRPTMDYRVLFMPIKIDRILCYDYQQVIYKWRLMEYDGGLETLLLMDGVEHFLENGYWWKIEAR